MTYPVQESENGLEEFLSNLFDDDLFLNTTHAHPVELAEFLRLPVEELITRDVTSVIRPYTTEDNPYIIVIPLEKQDIVKSQILALPQYPPFAIKGGKLATVEQILNEDYDHALAYTPAVMFEGWYGKDEEDQDYEYQQWAIFLDMINQTAHVRYMDSPRSGDNLVSADEMTLDEILEWIRDETDGDVPTVEELLDIPKIYTTDACMNDAVVINLLSEDEPWIIADYAPDAQEHYWTFGEWCLEKMAGGA